MSEQPEDPDRSAYDPTGLAPGSPAPEVPAGESRSLPPLREVAEIRRPSTVGGVVYLVVLAAAVTGVVIAATGPWRTGVSWLAAALVGGAVARVVLPDGKAGMLRVRRTWLDALILAAVGALLIFLAGTIPDQPL